MKIAHIAPPWIAIPPKNYGGTENVIYHLVEEQVAQGHDVTLFAPGDAQTSAHLISFFPQALSDAGVPWHAHLKAYYHYYKAVEYINSHHFDILHLHLSSGADMYLFPLTVHMETPRVVTLHSCFPFDRVQGWTGDADLSYMPWMSEIPMVAISNSARAQVKHPLYFADVIHHGLPMQDFPMPRKRPGDYLTWLGRIIPDKGTHLAIEVARQTGRPLILAGIVDPNIPEAVEYFESKIKPHVDGEQVKYIGPVGMREKIKLLGNAYGFLNPIQWEEPFGMVMIEAMAVGCPVISFERGAAPEIIASGETGFLVHNVQQMSAHVERMADIDRRYVRAHVEQNFSVRTMTEKYIHLYRRILANSLLQPALNGHSIKRTVVKPEVTKILAKTGSSYANKTKTPTTRTPATKTPAPHKAQIIAKAKEML